MKQQMVSVKEAKKSLNAREQFIEQHRSFVAKAASEVCKRPLHWENDDELSEALVAFNEAIESFDGRQSFYSYARMVIRRRLIDYFRREKRHRHLRLVSPLQDESEDSSAKSLWEIREAEQNFALDNERRERAAEIQFFCSVLAAFKIDLQELVDKSPTHAKTRSELLRAAEQVAARPELVAYIMEKKRLPLRQLTSVTGLSRKVLKTWRKYLIALVIIASNSELLILRDFVGFKR